MIEKGPGGRRPRWGLWAVVGLGACLALAAGLVKLNGAPPGASGGLVEIERGMTARAIAGSLADKGLLRSRRWFVLLARLRRADARLKAGLYRVRSRAPAHGILDDLILGRGAAVRVTVPEGFAVWQMGARFEAEGLCSASAFSAAAAPWEGFLFPETYFFEPGASAASIVETMKDRFEREWAAALAEAGPAVLEAPAGAGPEEALRLADGRRWTVRQIVTLASLVERETRRPEERPLVSAVYHNRLRINMRLECDPTVQYALGGWKRPLYKKDLEVESPYNTYRRYGLPPGPIAGPGRASLVAALAPAAADHLYFVSDGAGGHRFSSTYADHQKAVAQLRRLRAEENQLE